MEKDKAKAIIKDAIKEIAKKSLKSTDGKWLEDLTAKVSPYIKEWDVARCYHWREWPEREEHFSDSINKKDLGIDAVAIRRSDGGHIAIQCKSRKLDESGQGNPISKKEIDSFSSITSSKFWAERWIVTNGNNPINSNAQQAIEMADKPIKIIHIANDLQQQQDTVEDDAEECRCCSDAHLEGVGQRKQSKNCMQKEAVAKSVSILKKHERTNSGGLPLGQARGRIILPCGTGKTRISLRIVEELTPPGELSIVLCPSIALVAQIRREYLQRAKTNIRPLAVCSDKTAGYNPKKEDSQNTATDPTVDGSFVSESEVKGQVTTDPEEIADWIKKGQGTEQVSVIFGTYQSGSRVAEALRETGVVAKVLIADEAHRTAGLRRKKKRVIPAATPPPPASYLRRRKAHSRLHFVPRQ